MKVRDESSSRNSGVGNDIKGAEVLWKGDPTEIAGAARIEGRFGRLPVQPKDRGLPGTPNSIPGQWGEEP